MGFRGFRVYGAWGLELRVWGFVGCVLIGLGFFGGFWLRGLRILDSRKAFSVGGFRIL